MLNFTFFRKTIWAVMLLTFTAVQAQEITLKWERITPKYPTADAFVAGLNVMDYGADPTGTTDQTKLFQDLLDKLGSRSRNNGTLPDGTPNGGVLYVPEGKYLFAGSLFIPKGVTIRGDWEKPVKGQPIKGTILMAKNGRGNDATALLSYEGRALFTLQPSAAVRDLNIWYPDQTPDNIVPYPPAIVFGQQGYWGNDYVLASNITLVNAFDGVILSRRAGGGAPNYYGIYGTPLRRGIEIDNIAEVGRVDNVDFSPDYWAGSGLPGSPSLAGPHKKYIYENATAITVRRIDWSFVCKARIEGYKIGYRLDLSYNKDENGNYTSPNGHNYGMEFINCQKGVSVAALSGAGMLFYEYKFTGCDYGFFLENDPKGIMQIQKCEFDVSNASVYTPANSSSKVIINQSTFNNGPLDLRGGLASVIGCTFNNDSNHVFLGLNARTIITGNTFKTEPDIKNGSLYPCIIDHDPVEMTEIPHFPYINQYDFKQKPSGNAYFLATDHGVSVASDDNSPALQTLLNQAKAAGGGLVFLPPGHYKFCLPITIPTGVELKGATDTPSLPTGPGTVMEIYAGKDDENGTPFITMEEGSGIRGLVMNYPEQVVQLLTEPERNGGDVYHYPYCIRGNKDVYIVNIALRAVYHGVDLFTNKCDNHYVDYLAGHVFRTGIRVGGGSKGGHIYNSQFNQIAYGSGGETKFGAWPNSPDNNQPDKDKYRKEHDLAYAYCWNHLDFLILEDCEDEVVYNNFDFGSNRGFVLGANGKAPTGICLGQGIDAGMKAFYIEGVDNKGTFNFINTQIVTTAPGNPGEVEQTYKDNNRYIQVDPAFTGHVTFFGAEFWGQPQTISNDITNGTIELQAGNYSNSGQRAFASVGTGAKFDVKATNINNIGTLLIAGSAPQFYVQSSMLNKGNVNPSDCGLWLNNLDFTATVSPDAGAFQNLDRTRWIATASVRTEDAMKTLDSDVSTRWSTMSENQKPGQWFKVDMLEDQDFTGIYIDPGANTYLPIAFTVSVSSDGDKWQDISSGRNTPMSVFEAQKARYVKVTQTGTGSTSWRITEFYLLNSPIPPVISAIKDIVSKKDKNVWFSENRLNISGTGIVRVYNISGQQVLGPVAFQNSVPVNFPSGIYIVLIESEGKIYREKVIKK